MAEEKYDLGSDDGIVMPKSRFGVWFENFWYHYKWHTIFALFIILVVTVCSVQMCSKEEYDVHIIYAGSEDIRALREENDISKYQTVMKSLNEAVEDFDGNGRVSSSFEAMFMLTAEEIAEKKKELEEGYEIDEYLISQNTSLFVERITYSDTYVFILSDSIYKKYQTLDYDVPMFASIIGLKEEGSSAEFLDDYAVYLSSTEFGKLPGLADLPENTVIVLRSASALTSHFNRDEAVELYNNAEKVVSNMINYGK